MMKEVSKTKGGSIKSSTISSFEGASFFTGAAGRSHWGQYWLNSTDPSNRSNDPGKTNKGVWAGRILFIFVLTTLLGVLAWLAFKLLSDHESRLAETQFQSISERALVQAKDGLLSRRWAAVAMAHFVSDLYPSADQWPFIEWFNFEEVVESMLETSRGEEMGFVPFVKPENLTDFEEFAKEVYRKKGFPNDTAVDPNYGFGVWGRDRSVTPPKKYHDTTAETPYESPYEYELLAPIFRTDEGVHPVLLFNVHSQKFTGEAIDKMISCSEIRKEIYYDQVMAEGNASEVVPVSVPPHQCGVITDVFYNVKLGGRFAVGNFLPIYPRNNPLEVVGYIPAMLAIDTLLENAFSKTVTGIDAVFESDALSVTYKIIEGVPQLVGEGKRHDKKYEAQQVQIQMADPEIFRTEDGTNTTKKFIFSLTPNDDFYEVYETPGPIVAAIVVAASILLTMLVFFLYDLYVRREFNAKKDLLESRRQFMRFVSHEVRTPLNAVAMGLDLMLSEVGLALGFDSASSTRALHDFVEEDGDGGNVDDMSSRALLSKPTKSRDQQPQTETRQKNVKISSKTAKSWVQLIQEVQGNAQGAVDILNDLLNYDKIEQGKLHLSLEALSAWELVEKAVLEFKVPASSKEVNLGLVFGEETRSAPRAQDVPEEMRNLKVIGDPVRLTQVVRNLMSNALKFTPAKGSITVRALYTQGTKGEQEEVALQRGGVVSAVKSGSVRIQVIDTGAGMSQEQVTQLFQDGVQFNVNELQAGGGSGLGLYIAKGIVMQHKGALTATSEGLGHGTTFELELPLWELMDDEGDIESNLYNREATERTGAPSVASSFPNNSPKCSLKVLVVDDVKSNRKLLMRLLEKKGHICFEAEDGKQAVEIVKKAEEEQEPFDSVLLDYEMPVMNGPNAAKEIRQTLLDEEINIIGVTGNVLPEDVSYFEKCGANAVLSKPVKVNDLIACWLEQCILMDG